MSVFAGSLGDAEPLATWDEVDPTGLPVRWVAIRPWVHWSDRHNFSNPPIEEAFARYLDEVRPDVVHLHSLQSLGGGLVEVAHRAGCAVVVTMHDFWWICARQFLVDRRNQPCSLVVEAGCCQCEVDRPWLEERTRALDQALKDVDLVLAPSRSAVEVLCANGVAGGRVELDENGIPAELLADLTAGAPEPRRDRGSRSRTVVYAGGPDLMKGWRVLLEAVTLMAAASDASAPGPDWALVAYGIDRASVPRGLPIDPRPAFAEDTLTEVLADADVLVLPSVMRETFSLLTREALCRGVPVVATDTLGPEEVIRDGHNGLVVPAADPAALADALRRVLEEPGLLDHLRAGCRDPVPMRSVADQVVGVEQRYRDVLSARRANDTGPAPGPEGAASASLTAPRPATRRAPIRNVVFAVGIDDAPLRYRAHLPAESLALVSVNSEVRYYRDPQLPELLGQADAAVFYRVPATHQVLDLIASAHRRSIPVLFDVDDLIFDPGVASEIPALAALPRPEADLWMEGVRRYRTTMEQCDVFVGSTIPLCEHANAVTGLPARHFANGVGVVLARLSEAALLRPRRTGPPRIGYFSGTTTHDQDWALVEKAVLQVLDKRPDTELWLGGHVTPSPALDQYAVRARVLPMMPWTELPTVLRDVDVNLAPLVLDSRFNQAKSAIKWLEAALVDTPTVASPTQPFREAIDDGETGLLASSPDDWAVAIDQLLGDPRGGAAMARKARRQALLTLSPHLQGQRYLAILEEAADLAAAGGRPRPSSWVPVAHDQPPMRVPLSPYPPSDEPIVPPSPPLETSDHDDNGQVNIVRRTTRSLRYWGVRTTVRHGVDAGRRHLDDLRRRS